MTLKATLSFIPGRFKVQKKKEGTGRIVMWQQMGILNSFTMEATFAGYNNVHFNSRDLEDMGYHFCDTLLDYCDPDPSKVSRVKCTAVDHFMMAKKSTFIH